MSISNIYGYYCYDKITLFKQNRHFNPRIILRHARRIITAEDEPTMRIWSCGIPSVCDRSTKVDYTSCHPIFNCRDISFADDETISINDTYWCYSLEEPVAWSSTSNDKRIFNDRILNRSNNGDLTS